MLMSSYIIQVTLRISTFINTNNNFVACNAVNTEITMFDRIYFGLYNQIPNTHRLMTLLETWSGMQRSNFPLFSAFEVDSNDGHTIYSPLSRSIRI